MVQANEQSGPPHLSCEDHEEVEYYALEVAANIVRSLEVSPDKCADPSCHKPYCELIGGMAKLLGTLRAGCRIAKSRNASPDVVLKAFMECMRKEGLIS